LPPIRSATVGEGRQGGEANGERGVDLDYARIRLLSPNVNDYRCVVNATGDAVIVERRVLNADGGGSAPQLYIVDLGAAARPRSSSR
jgi:hypothetical protein